MSMASGSKLQLEPGSWLEALYDIYIGTVVGAAHSIYITAKWWYVNVAIPLSAAFGYELKQDKEIVSKDGEKTLKVVAVGFGRTGTVRGCLPYSVMVEGSPAWFRIRRSAVGGQFCHMCVTDVRETAYVEHSHSELTESPLHLSFDNGNAFSLRCTVHHHGRSHSLYS